MGGRNTQGGLQDSLSGTSAVKLRSESLSHQPQSVAGDQEGGSGSSGRGHDPERSDRDRSSDVGVLLQDFPGPKTRRSVETDYRSIESEPVRVLSEVQNGNACNYTQGGTVRPMVDLPRLKGCVLSCTNTSGAPLLSQVLPLRQNLAVQGLAFRSLHSTKGVHESAHPRPFIRPSAWRQATYVPGRLVAKPGYQRAVNRTHYVALKALHKSRVDCQLGEVRNYSKSINHIPGYYAGHKEGPSLPSTLPFGEMAFHSSQVLRAATATSSCVAPSTGASSFPREASAIWKSSNPTGSNSAQSSLDAVNRLSNAAGPPQRGDQGVVGLVATPAQTGPGCSPGSGANRPLSIHGQQPVRLGCPCIRSLRLGHLVRCSCTTPYKCSRAESRMARSPVIRGTPGRLHCCNYVRQHVCHCLCQKSGGYKIFRNERFGVAALSLGRAASNDASAQTSPWAPQCIRRLPESPQSDIEGGMEPEPVHNRQGVQVLGQSTRGSIRPQPEQETGNLHVTNMARRQLEGRQSSPLLEGAVRLRVPPDHTDPVNSEQDSVRQSDSDPNSPFVAESGVVPRSSGSDNRLPIVSTSISTDVETDILTQLPSGSSDPPTSRLALIARSAEERGFSGSVSKRISIPQKGSTIKVYEAKWKVFGEWCQSQGIDPCTPSIPVIADFLLYCFDERKLTLSAIKGYKSSLSQVMSSRGIDISHDKDLAALIRSFSVERPLSHREVPRWDLMVVMRHLMKPPYEPMHMSSTAYLTRKTAFLIMLATAKRNSEVWAFSADAVFGTGYSSVTLSFLPGFIAKTQKPDVPGTELQPVTFPALAPSLTDDLPDRYLCPVRALRFYLDRTKAGLDPKRPKRLFVAHKVGHSGDIGKTTISGWVKTVIRDAYESVSEEDLPFLTYKNFQAREVRALATSLAFHQHYSLSQVMKAASWRASGTFAAFYLRDISPSNLTTNLGPFVAGQTLVRD